MQLKFRAKFHIRIVVVNLPGINQACRKSDDTEKDIINPNGNWITVKSRKEYDDLYPSMPIRIIDNFELGITDDKIVSITVVNWDRIYNNISALKTLKQLPKAGDMGF